VASMVASSVCSTFQDLKLLGRLFQPAVYTFTPKEGRKVGGCRLAHKMDYSRRQFRIDKNKDCRQTDGTNTGTGISHFSCKRKMGSVLVAEYW
jgi:hypothetical protein